MFGKLLKYEFKSLGKWYLSLYAIIGLLSLVIGFWVRTITYRAEHNSRFVEHGPATAEAWLLGITVFCLCHHHHWYLNLDLLPRRQPLL